MHRLSLASATIGPVPAIDLISAAAAAGFDSVGLRFKSRDELPPPWNPREPIPVAEMKRRINDSGLTVLQVEAFHIWPKPDWSEFELLFDAAANVGAEHALVSVNDSDYARALESFVHMCRLAETRRMRIALEFKDDSVINTLKAAGDFIAASAQLCAGICLDTYHFSRSGGVPTDLKAIDDRSIFFVQFSDAPAKLPSPDRIRKESRTGRLYPGHGELWLGPLLDALPPDIPLDLEASGASDPALSFTANAKNAAAATRDFLATHCQDRLASSSHRH